MTSDDKFMRAAETLASMCIDARIGKVDKETFVSNLRMFANIIEYGNELAECDNCGESYHLSIYVACPNCHTKKLPSMYDGQVYDEHVKEIHR